MEDRLVLIVGMSCAVLLGGLGCGPPPSTPLSVPAANHFCRETPQAAPGRIAKCEDFRDVAEGHLPQGWIGEGGVGTMPSKALVGENVLAAVRPGKYRLAVPWRFGSDYRVDWKLRAVANDRCGLYATTLTIGSVVMQFGGGGSSHHVEIREAKPADVQDAGVPESEGKDFASAMGAALNTTQLSSAFHEGSVIRSGKDYKVLIDGADVRNLHAKPGTNADAITVESEGCGGFSLAGLRVDGTEASAAAAPAKPASPSGGQVTVSILDPATTPDQSASGSVGDRIVVMLPQWPGTKWSFASVGNTLGAPRTESIPGFVSPTIGGLKLTWTTSASDAPGSHVIKLLNRNMNDPEQAATHVTVTVQLK